MVTAPMDSSSLASVVAQFSNSVSDCSTFGPFPPGDPDWDKATNDGMVPDVILFHATREDKAAEELFIHLGNYIPLQRSYKLLAKKYYQLPAGVEHPHIVWLQFGTNVKWNSQQQRQKPASHP
jgi:hypothetical protein